MDLGMGWVWGYIVDFLKSRKEIEREKKEAKRIGREREEGGGAKFYDGRNICASKIFSRGLSSFEITIDPLRA